MSFESKNPTTGELLGTYPEHSAHDVEQRLQSAWDGWKHWSHTPLSERTAFLFAWRICWRAAWNSTRG